MPQHKSCEKRIRVSKKQNAYNRSIASAVKTATKKFVTAEADTVEEQYRQVSAQLDLAARKGVIPKQRASRKKSRMARARNRKLAAGS